MSAQLDLLTSVAENPTPIADGYRRRIRAAIKADAAMHDGEAHPNRVRARLLHPASGRLDVDPRMLSATYSALAAQKVLAFDRWDTNDDTLGGNAGKPQRVWRLVGDL